ncbi:hypothetical protein B0I18_11620 [Taibaiella chishuiensis]|uniref:Uncharacterized protein n=1 Tax=Taibaiella chishuiensis TaxID=1434707 RepID=A0A2P8CSQ3_9BACT|nr:hypothetical protein B0I18_11620 [Taibaiella chishuiensis]
MYFRNDMAVQDRKCPEGHRYTGGLTFPFGSTNYIRFVGYYLSTKAPLK